ncbi:hypothetical protein [Acidobacterium sp. S8]|uniref:hypothetical protein n=1 Tax=Acidobacterium sp. S8 TaxID=1641854 RepID=UPI00131B76EC|nr:hypothetical protein [Acidobacterium sp. S8]
MAASSEQPGPALQQRQAAVAFALATAFLGLINALLRQSLPRGRECSVCALLAITLIAFPFEASIYAVGQLPPGIAAVTVAATPLLVCLIGYSSCYSAPIAPAIHSLVRACHSGKCIYLSYLTLASQKDAQ